MWGIYNNVSHVCPSLSLISIGQYKRRRKACVGESCRVQSNAMHTSHAPNLQCFFEVKWPHKTDQAIFNFFNSTSLQYTFYVTLPDKQMKLGKEKYCSI